MTSASETTNTDTAARARHLHELHAHDILVLPNSWDAASTRIVIAAGARAIATSSAAVAWSLGRPDGNALALAAMLDHLAKTIAAAGGVPVSADLEAGFGDNDDEVAESVRAVIEVGAVGINIEDQNGGAFRSVEAQSARLKAVRAAADETEVPLYVNARTDTYLVGAGDFDETIERARAYLAAGASGIFVPGVADLELIRRLVAAIDGPLNVLVGPGSPSIGALRDAGVRRASAGSSIAQAIHGHTRRAAEELLGAGTYAELADPLDYGAMNALMG